MSKNLVINPRGTACWLIDNTSLTFDQIADFCEIHYMEVEAIANDEVKISPCNPIENFQLTKEEIAKCEADETRPLKLSDDAKSIIFEKTKGKKYIGIAKKNDALCGSLYCLAKYPQLTDKSISKLTGATVGTVAKLRDGTHPAIKSLSPRNPVMTGLCTQKDLDAITMPISPSKAKHNTLDDFVISNEKEA